MATPRNVTAPNLPIPPGTYSQPYHSQSNLILRLFFTGLTNWINTFSTTYQKQVLLTGFVVTIVDTFDVFIIDAVGVLATGTLTMPADPIDGQIIEITSHFNVTAFTLNANAGQSIWGWTNGTLLTAGAGIRFVYTATDGVWNRLN